MTLSCDSRANPPVTMVWQRDGQVLDLLEGRYTTMEDGVTARLSVSRVKRHLHQGLYSCLAHSPVEGQRTKSFRLTITGLCLRYSGKSK